MREHTATIHFHDHGDDQEGAIVVYRVGDRIVLVMTVEENGDAAAIVERAVVEKLIAALRAAMR